MPTCRDVITRAFRKAKVYGTGESPSAADLADAMDELQSLYEQWGSNGMFGRLTDKLEESDYDAQPFERVQTAGGTITLPDTQEFDTEAAPFSLSFIEVIDTDAETVTRYLYENGAWVTINALTLDDEAPLSGRGMAGLAACLAMEMGEWGGEIGPGIARQAAAFKAGLATRLGTETAYTAPEWH